MGEKESASMDAEQKKKDNMMMIGMAIAMALIIYFLWFR